MKLGILANASTCHLLLIPVLRQIFSLLLDFLISPYHNYGWENKIHPASSPILPQNLKATEIPYNWTKCIHTGSEILCIT